MPLLLCLANFAREQRLSVQQAMDSFAESTAHTSAAAVTGSDSGMILSGGVPAKPAELDLTVRRHAEAAMQSAHDSSLLSCVGLQDVLPELA